jgi:hypothetical protein
MLPDLIGEHVMDWKRAVEEERAALKRIVALLLALADLAESASRRSQLVRRFVIWVLRQAETVARDFVIGVEAPAGLMPLDPAGDGPADAMRLAQSFRDLARELDRQARLALVIQDGIQDDTGQAGLAGLGACRMPDTNNFLNALRRAFTNIAGQVACATGPPDTS